MLASRDRACVVLIDVQDSFLKAIDGSGEVFRKCQFMLEIAQLLGIPVIATEQYPYRMGGTREELLPYLTFLPIPKMCFSCAESPEFMAEIGQTGKTQVVLIGIETHICVNQTAHHLIDKEYEVILAADAVGSRTAGMHQIGLRRIELAGAAVAHSESIAYEWLHSAEDPLFRQALAIVKRYAD